MKKYMLAAEQPRGGYKNTSNTKGGYLVKVSLGYSCMSRRVGPGQYEHYLQDAKGEVFEIGDVKTYSKGTYSATVTSTNPNEHPENGHDGKYWYVKRRD